jgi:hypothetical protein
MKKLFVLLAFSIPVSAAFADAYNCEKGQEILVVSVNSDNSVGIAGINPSFMASATITDSSNPVSVIYGNITSDSSRQIGQITLNKSSDGSLISVTLNRHGLIDNVGDCTRTDQ